VSVFCLERIPNRGRQTVGKNRKKFLPDVGLLLTQFRGVAGRLFVLSGVALWLLAAGLPTPASAMVSASLTWNASSAPNVAGYNIYYGSGSHQYTNMLAVGAVTNTVISNLTEGVTYFFAAKTCDCTGKESDFSNEAIFCGITTFPGVFVTQAVLPTNSTGDSMTFCLTSNAPPGAVINTTNGVFGWDPDVSYASTTNEITVLITDNNTSSTSAEVLLVVVTDYLEVGLGTATVQTGQPGSLPITLAASDQITNLEFSVDWPTDRLTIPTLVFTAPVVAGSVQPQGSTILVQLQIAPGQSFPAAGTIAQLNFQALANQSSAFVNVGAWGASGIKSDSSTYGNVSASPGEVTVVGTNPLLRLNASAGQNSLTLFGNPGANYQVQFTTNLMPPVVWAPVLNHQQSSVSESVNLDNSQPAVYYRLQQF
jgi:hypothetical protein